MGWGEIVAIIFIAVPILVFFLVGYDVLFNNISYDNYGKPFITDDMSPQEKWHRSVTLFGDPTPWDDDHFR